MPPSPRSLTRDQVRELDRLAIGDYGIPGVVLMENAARACVAAAVEMLGSPEGKRVAAVCGRGNNGGDGFVIARHLANRGADVRVLALGSTADMLGREGDAAVNLRIALKMGIPVRDCTAPGSVHAALGEGPGWDLVVDAMLGTGINGRVRDPFAAAIEAVNAGGWPVLAVDLPSGLDCDTGEPLGMAVKADRTVTFVARKAGFSAPGAAHYTGPVTIAEIGIPAREVRKMMGGESP